MQQKDQVELHNLLSVPDLDVERCCLVGNRPREQYTVSVVSTCSWTSFFGMGKWLAWAKAKSIKMLDALELIDANDQQLTFYGC